MNTIIEKIRAEMERRKKQMVGASYPSVIRRTRISELSIVLDILDDIQERTDNPITFTLQEQPVKIDIRKELASIEFMGVNDARDTETIARHFYALGQQSKEQPVCEDAEMEIKETELEYQQRSERGEYPVSIESICRRFYELGRQSKEQPACDGLVEVAGKYEDMCVERADKDDYGRVSLPSVDVYNAVIYGANWQRNRLLPMIDNICKRCRIQHEKIDEIPVSDVLDEAAKKYAHCPFTDDDGNFHEDAFDGTAYRDFIAGAKWDMEQMMKSPLVSIGNTASEELQRINYENGKKDMKEQMMKEAVEGEVVTTNKYTSVRYLSRYGTFRYFYGIGGGFQKGDKVKLIIIKED